MLNLSDISNDDDFRKIYKLMNLKLLWLVISSLVIPFVMSSNQIQVQTGSNVSEQNVGNSSSELNNAPNVGAVEFNKNYVTEQSINTLEKFIGTKMEQLKVPGVAVGVIENGRVLHLKGYGVSGNGAGKITAHSTFKIGSVTKSFTAIAILQLVEEGKVDLDAQVTEYLPWFKTYNPSRSDAIKIKYLLNHTSGFSTYDGNRNQNSKDKSRDIYEKAVRELSKMQLVSEPGSRFQYSNVNYQILGLLLEKIEGDSYEQVINQRIFSQLKMSDSYLERNTENTRSESAGHLYFFGSPEPIADDLGRVTLAQGGIYSSVDDLLKYLGALLKTDNPLISEKTASEMFSINGDKYSRGYGYGWFVGQLGKKPIIFHDGRSPGFTSSVALLPSENLGIVILVNASDSFGDKNIGLFTVAIADILLGQPPRDTKPSLFEIILIWSTYLLGISFVVLIILTLVKLRKNQMRIVEGSFRKAMGVCGTFIIPGAIVYTLLIALPNSYGVPLNAVALNEPTLYLGMLVCSVSASIFVVIQLLLKRRSRLSSS